MSFPCHLFEVHRKDVKTRQVKARTFFYLNNDRAKWKKWSVYDVFSHSSISVMSWVYNDWPSSNLTSVCKFPSITFVLKALEPKTEALDWWYLVTRYSCLTIGLTNSTHISFNHWKASYYSTGYQTSVLNVIRKWCLGDTRNKNAPSRNWANRLCYYEVFQSMCYI